MEVREDGYRGGGHDFESAAKRTSNTAGEHEHDSNQGIQLTPN